ncbi:hypothetical protein Tco_0752450 [Tanacetum coccineum]|uniref:Gag-pol polyprotein n=1 Tax=Tanacetum coccineum TaxID=301880 RepID=A0ABQ4Z6W2_9ASTR
MKSYGDQINKEAVVSKVLRSLSSKFNHGLNAHEDRLNSAQEQTEEKAFQVKGDSSSKGIVESSDSAKLIEVVIVVVVVMAEVAEEEEVNMKKDT